MPFPLLVVLLLNLRKGSAEQELDQFFSTLHDRPLAHAPTRSALWKARQNLDPKVFLELNQQAITQFTARLSSPRYYGFRLLAVDGTTLRLPASKAVQQAFGESTDGPPLARVSTLYAVAANLILDAQMAATCVSERELAIDHLDHARDGDLVIYDRGYPAFWLMALHRVRGVDFCMRLSRNSFGAVKAFRAADHDSEIVTIQPTVKQRRHCSDQAISAEPLRVRLVRVHLSGGETEVLATSVLDEKRLPARCFAALYHKRWSTEESYKRQKRWLEIENFSGRSPLALHQDFRAKILALNLTAMVRYVADIAARRYFEHRRHVYQTRWTNALSTMKNTLVRLLLQTAPNRDNLWRRVVELIARAADPIRPDRSFPRHRPGKLKTGFHMQYRRTA